MHTLNTAIAIFLIAVGLQAQPTSSSSLTERVRSAESQYGVFNYRTVLPGVLYRGGSSGDKGGKYPLTAASQQSMCEGGFSDLVYAYTSEWSGGEKSVQCSRGESSYSVKRWDRASDLKLVLEKLYSIILSGKGAMYVHCYYGVHASGYIATVALMQFCGLSGEEGVEYWNSNVPKTIQYAKVQQMIRAFQPYSHLSLTSEQRARICLVSTGL